MAGNATLAMAVSSEAIASAVKIAATAHRRRSGGKPSMTGDACFAAVASVAIPQNSPDRRRVVPSPAGCTMDRQPPTDTMLHDAYAEAQSLKLALTDPGQAKFGRARPTPGQARRAPTACRNWRP